MLDCFEAPLGNGGAISPIFIASHSSSSSIGYLTDVQSVSTKASLARLKDEKCETSSLRVVSGACSRDSSGLHSRQAEDEDEVVQV